MKDKVAVIIGATSMIGRACAWFFLNSIDLRSEEEIREMVQESTALFPL